MKKSTLQMLKLFFNQGETMCVSPNKYGYHSVSQESLVGDIILESPNEKVETSSIKENEINMLAMNPINGFRSDANVTAYRTFLVELDDGSLQSQKEYIERMGMPYSVCVFSGNKSLHYGIVLDEDLPDYHTWKIHAEWILNIMKGADQLTKNPSRSIRFPNNQRHDGKQLMQSLVDIRGRVSLNRLNMWLHQHPKCKPRPPAPPQTPDTIPSYLNIPDWIIQELEAGVYYERNSTWFKVAIALTKKNFSEGEVIAILEPYFVEQPDFKYNEWLISIRHGIKTALQG